MVKRGSKPNAGHYICAWYGKDLGPSGTTEDSHGICPECLEKMKQKQRQRRRRKR